MKIKDLFGNRGALLIQPRLILAWAALAISLSWLAGCLTNPSNSSPNQPALEDNDHLAGASSSTNWPTDVGGATEVHVMIVSHKPLQIAFTQSLGFATDPGQHPIRLTGKATVYLGNSIPALAAPVSISKKFSEANTLELPSSMLDSLPTDQEDSVPINLRIQTDTSEGWVFGLIYQPREKAIIETPLSIETDTLLVLQRPETRYQGMVDTLGKLASVVPSGKTTLCFYIPGSPFFGKVDSGAFKIGPLPKANFPLRLLRVTYWDNPSSAQVEAYTVGSVQIPSVDSLDIFTPGRRIFSERISGSLSLQPN